MYACHLSIDLLIMWTLGHSTNAMLSYQDGLAIIYNLTLKLNNAIYVEEIYRQGFSQIFRCSAPLICASVEVLI